ARLLDRQRPGRRLGADLRRPRLARAQGHSRRMATLRRRKEQLALAGPVLLWGSCKLSASIALPQRCHCVPAKCTAAAKDRCGAALPADARFCPSCAAAVEREPEPTEERKLATVLFADLVGSTELGGSQDPERTRALLDRFYDAMAAEIEGAGGTVEKFVGD